ncbi:substrate-binding domain-containing protein [Amycolatopsis sp. GM8]|uniref:substrate-binding domain-containing protein n=1 Tax=Amycolatopsis sp. GM8 TaxID=2896530 RepID=UPI001F2311A4|nr:substrate-binding domain-containing protein [Amycolatopsis sp. GM8]
MVLKKLVRGALVAALLVPAACASSATTTDSGGGAVVDAAQVSAAKDVVAKASTFPTSIPVTEPLPSRPPAGKTLVFLQCEQQECHHEGEGMRAATQAIGWDLKTLNFKASDPATLVAALRTALQYKPVGVYFSGVPQAVWSSVQAEYAAAGSYITDSYVIPAPSGAGIEAGHGYDDHAQEVGRVAANAQLADSGGQAANSLLVSVPDYPVFNPTAQAYHDVIAKSCPSCKVTDVNVTLPQLLGGQLVPAVVSAAKRTPGVKYIVAVNGSFTAQLPQALKGAGLDGKFKLISGTGISRDQQNVLAGTQLATMNSQLEMGGWQDVDIAVRKVMGLPVPAGDHAAPVTLLTKDNIGTPRDSYDLPADFAGQFKKLWKVAG